MKFFVGFVIGAVLGAAGMWGALTQPWNSGAETAMVRPDAGADEPAAKKKKKSGKRKRRSGGGEGGEGGEGDGYEPPPVLSASERESVWRGAAVKPPPRRFDMEGGDQGRPLSGAEINKTIQSSSSGITRCIGDSRGGAELKATISLKLLVDGDGRVTKVRARAPRYLFDHGFLACVDGAAKAMRFPATGDATVVDAPFELY